MARETQGGFEPRFIVTRTDGKPCRASAHYIVLDYAGDPHAKKALATYADSVEVENPAMAADVRAAIIDPTDFPKQHYGDKVLLGVNGSFVASHVCGETEPHWHKWNVEAKYAVAPHTDMRCYRAALDHLLNKWDGLALPGDMEWSEDIARTVGLLVNCVAVHVWRDDERIHAWWPAR
jgi:hypothetical protein